MLANKKSNKGEASGIFERVTGVTLSDGPAMNAFLDRGTKFEGKLTFEGTVRIDGKFQGDIYSKDRLVIGEGGEVEGTVEVGHCIISGTFRGELKARERIELQAPARFYGTLIAPTLVVAEGVTLEGNVKMEGIYKEVENALVS
jgi:cytoskeletal protein CcmA (bactofilin family)